MFNSDNRIHINFSMERASDGSIIRSTILANIYESELQSAVELYRELKKQLEDNPGIPLGQTSHQEEIIDSPTCPIHKCKMVLRTRRDGTGFFWGCPMYNQGCKKTAQYPITQETRVIMPSVQI